MTLVAQPAVGLKKACKLLLKHPDKPDKWQAPGVPDASAGEWPAEVVATLAEMVTSLTLEDEDDRMDLGEALQRLEQIVKKYPVEALPPAQQPEVAKDCVFCLEKPRDVRFECGHCVVCTECLGVMRADALRQGTS